MGLTFSSRWQPESSPLKTKILTILSALLVTVKRGLASAEIVEKGVLGGIETYRQQLILCRVNDIFVATGRE
mgnify:CR=1 FL=1